MFIKVDLPEPDGPIIATKSPRSTCKSSSRRAKTAMSPCPYTLVNFVISITLSVIISPLHSGERPAVHGLRSVAPNLRIAGADNLSILQPGENFGADEVSQPTWTGRNSSSSFGPTTKTADCPGRDLSQRLYRNEQSVTRLASNDLHFCIHAEQQRRRVLGHVDAGPGLNRRCAVNLHERRFDARDLASVGVLGKASNTMLTGKAGHGGGNVKFLDPETNLPGSGICQADESVPLPLNRPAVQKRT